ncbi:hypothetical protein CODIS_30490 [Candidatus Thiodiazotropha endolucinida]|uniref:Uncharacterized protein n=1 Tax=Candidatus Thiodiazotropha endolucinida TaxID=1655433 RepID=A0A7Z0VJI5_9GAMM|nr:hypothetical protein CODIS_30490 [Candidatus Thiodiazotropha endolucinida]
MRIGFLLIGIERIHHLKEYNSQCVKDCLHPDKLCRFVPTGMSWRTIIAQHNKPMIFWEKVITIHNLSTIHAQREHPFPQLHTQYLVVDISQIGYILCLLF